MICPLCHKEMKEFIYATSIGWPNFWCESCLLGYCNEKQFCWRLTSINNNIVNHQLYNEKEFQRLIKLKAFW